MKDEMIDAFEVGRMFGITGDAVRVWRRKGKIKGYKMGGKWMFRRADAEKIHKDRFPPLEIPILRGELIRKDWSDKG